MIYLLTVRWYKQFENSPMEAERRAMIAVAAALVLLSLNLSIVGAAPSGGCTEELLSFSACLPYVSSPPNNLTDTASTDCCNALRFQSYLCLCYLLRDPNFLGFPLNTTSLLSLSPLCNTLSTPQPQHPPPLPSLNLLCSATPSLPPLNSPASVAAFGGNHRGGSSGMGAGIASRFPILNGGAVAAPSTLISQILTILQPFYSLLVSITILSAIFC